MSKPPTGGYGKPHPHDLQKNDHERSVKGSVRIDGPVETQLPPKLVEEYISSSQQSDIRERKRFRVEKITLGSVLLVAVLSIYQSYQSTKSANAALDANRIARNNFRTDERPYLVQAPTGTPNEIIIVSSGPDAGKLRFSLHTENIGKSPALVKTQYFHAYIGDREISQIGSETVEGSDTVVPAGDKPVFWILSRKLTLEEVSYIQPRMNAMPVHVVLYGHLDYTDIFPDPKPAYASGFCADIASGDFDAKKSSVCNGRQYIR
jgi:hypothetical protein